MRPVVPRGAELEVPNQWVTAQRESAGPGSRWRWDRPGQSQYVSCCSMNAARSSSVISTPRPTALRVSK